MQCNFTTLQKVTFFCVIKNISISIFVLQTKKNHLISCWTWFLQCTWVKLSWSNTTLSWVNVPDDKRRARKWIYRVTGNAWADVQCVASPWVRPGRLQDTIVRHEKHDFIISEQLSMNEWMVFKKYCLPLCVTWKEVGRILWNCKMYCLHCKYDQDTFTILNSSHLNLTTYQFIYSKISKGKHLGKRFNTSFNTQIKTVLLSTESSGEFRNRTI